MKESKFQSDLIDELEYIFPGCIVTKQDSSFRQGIPDLIILWKDRWAMLECKRSANEPFQPNQKYYIRKANKVSFGAVIFPENREEVLHALEQSFRPRR